MFKQTEESEWTRFSRALQSQPPQRDVFIEHDDDTMELSTVVDGSAAPAATHDEAPTPSYARPEPQYASLEPAYEQVPPSAYDQAPPTSYSEAEPPAYEEPAPTPLPIPSAAVSSAADLTESAETVLGEDARLEGTLRSDRSIRIRGVLSGEIESRGQVVVEGTARVEARIVAEQVTVAGEVNGRIECAGRVEIAPTGRVTGEVTTGRLVIQEGAFFQGQLTMVPKEAASADGGAASSGRLDDTSTG